MIRFKSQRNPVLELAIGLTLAGVFVVDLITGRGVTDWVLYLIPVALTLYLWRPAVPLATAGACSLLIVAGLYLSPGSSAPHFVALVNRTFALVSIWTVAVIARQFILGRLRVAEETWIRSGQRDLANRMQGEHSAAELADVVLRFLCTYLEAAVGACYVADGDSDEFRCQATFGVEPGRARAVVRPGDALIGEVIKDRRLIRIDDVPADHLPVSSALGRSRPRHLLIAPGRVDDQVNVVVELGFVHAIGQADLDLLRSMESPIGVGLRSSILRTRTRELLAETQRQAKTLQEQQEELRVVNEELEEQARALRESEGRLQAQQAELEQTNAQLEEQAHDLQRQRDELARAQTELSRRAEELARANRYKSEFLANMSHELRTPLNSSLILAKLLSENRDGNLTADQVRYAETIYSAGNDLLSLISDILDLSRIEAGRLDVRPEPLKLARAVEPLARTFGPVAAEKGLAFKTTVEPSAPESLTTDPLRLQQILRNLLANAFKFTTAGEVSLRVAAGAPGRVLFAVADTGMGIAPEQQQMIFEPFCQGDGSTQRKFGGTGLGLSISRELARRLGGDLELASSPGRGSTFTLWLPVHATAGVEARPAELEPRVTVAALARLPAVAAAPAPVIDDDRDGLDAGSRSILVIEDDPSFARILHDLAHEQQFRCIIAPTAAEGLELAQKHRPSAVVLDIRLPDGSGLTVLEQLKRDPATRHIPVHVISVSDYSERALQLGALGFALKPTRREDLLSAFHKLTTKLEQQLCRVLVVEDVPLQRDSIVQLLRAEGVEIDAVGTGAEALERLEQTTFDCMVLDLALPDMSGYDLLDRMSSEEAYSFPPVIVYTGRSLSRDEEQRLRRYASSIIIKGARSPERLVDEVTLFLHRVEAKLPPVQQRMLREVRSRESLLDGRRVLLVEDDVRNVFALASALEPKGLELIIARNGKEALQALERDRAIDLVLMDIMMPEMDGLTATREIRKRTECKKLPIIALTAKAMSDDREKCLEAGASDYIAKPIEMDKLVSLIKVWLPK